MVEAVVGMRTPKTSKPVDLRDENSTRRRLLIALRYPKGIIGLSLVGGFAFLATLAPLIIPESLSVGITTEDPNKNLNIFPHIKTYTNEKEFSR